MMILRRLLTLSASAALHLSALGLWLFVASVGAGSAILIDLVADVTGEAVHDADPVGPRRPSSATAARPPTTRKSAASLPHRWNSAVAPMAALVQSDPATPAAKPETAVETRPKMEATAESGPPSPALSGPTGSPAPVIQLSGSTSSAEDTKPGEDRVAATPRVDSGVGGGVSPAGIGGPASGDSLRGPSAGNEPSGGGSSVARAAPGDGRGGIPPEYGPYLQRFRRRVQESLEYPIVARRRGLSGRVELEVLLEPSGRLGAVRVVSSSAHAVLDEAAVEAVRSLAPEPLPEQLPRRPLRIRLPLSFQLE